MSESYAGKRPRALGLTVASIGYLIFVASVASQKGVAAQNQAGAGGVSEAEAIDPAAWGSDHVGRAIPMYTTGDECLFCHREVGTMWQANRHNAGMRIVDLLDEAVGALLRSPSAAGFGPETAYVLGGTELLRFLKPNGKYGQFAMHAARANPREELRLTGSGGGWDNEAFAARCAGCHTTAVETEFRAFSAPSLDCFVCHGDVPAGHQNEPTAALLARKREREPLVEISLCAQCHLRGGKSKSSGLPYPNQFVAGDNLFRDFEVDLSDAAIAAMNPGDAHVFANVRDVIGGAEPVLSCVSCHDVHGQSSRKHRVLPKGERAAYCAICHPIPGDFKQVRSYEKHGGVCDY